MEKSRGKKGKKATWHLTLGLKDTIFAGVGVVGLMMISFALGALAGRGDIYRVAHSLGLMAPEAARVAQWSPGGTPPVGAPTAAEEAPPAAAPQPAAPAPPATTAAAKGTHPAPVTGSITATPAPAATAASKKKPKTAAVNRDPKSKEEEMRRVRQEVVRKLKFQNSFDTPAKSAHKPKEKEKAQATTASAKPPPQVRVAQYRDSKTAKARVAELQKQGVKATLKQTKDQKGVLYEVYKPGAAPQAGEKVAQKPVKSGTPAKKPKAE